jgi:hypothetical protein
MSAGYIGYITSFISGKSLRFVSHGLRLLLLLLIQEIQLGIILTPPLCPF